MIKVQSESFGSSTLLAEEKLALESIPLQAAADRGNRSLDLDKHGERASVTSIP